MTQYLDQAIALATRNVAAGGGPFGAVLVAPDGQVFEGVNRVTLDNDPTAHAEVVAIRAACSALKTFDLTGATLYSSCEPCPLCLSAALWARIDRVQFAADRKDAAAAGFDDAAFYQVFEQHPSHWTMPVTQAAIANSQDPFEAWEKAENRVEY
jgi:guanine deaminase